MTEGWAAPLGAVYAASSKQGGVQRGPNTPAERQAPCECVRWGTAHVPDGAPACVREEGV